MPELTIAAVEVEAVRGPAGRFPYPVQWQVQPLNVYLAPGETADEAAQLQVGDRLADPALNPLVYQHPGR